MTSILQRLDSMIGRPTTTHSRNADSYLIMRERAIARDRSIVSLFSLSLKSFPAPFWVTPFGSRCCTKPFGAVFFVSREPYGLERHREPYGFVADCLSYRFFYQTVMQVTVSLTVGLFSHRIPTVSPFSPTCVSCRLVACGDIVATRRRKSEKKRVRTTRDRTKKEVRQRPAA